MADGSSKPIDEIQVGDKVKATDSATGETSDRDVVARSCTPTKKPGHHGGCGEIGGLCQIERQGGSIWNATAESVDVMGGSENYGPERHGAPRMMCPSCQKLFKYLHIS